jgi:hypothetical protein
MRGAALLLKGGGASPRPVWALANTFSGGKFRPSVFYKPVGGSWRLQYSGADIPAADTCQFVRGLRHPDDPPGTISVRCTYVINNVIGQPNKIEANTYIAARSTDFGATWSFISSGDLGSTGGEANLQFTSLPNLLFSPAAGSLGAFALRTTGTQVVGPTTFIEQDVGLVSSVAGGAFGYSGGPSQPVVRVNAAGVRTLSASLDGPNAAVILTAPRALKTASAFANTGIFLTSTPTGVDPLGVAIAASSWTTVSPLAVTQPEAVLYDGQTFVLAGRNQNPNIAAPSDTLQRVFTSAAGAVWSQIYASGAGTIGPAAAARGPGKYNGSVVLDRRRDRRRRRGRADGYARARLARHDLGAAVVLCAPGPSMAPIARQPNLVIAALTKAYPVIVPDIWFGLDTPECYDRRLWRESFMKICRTGGLQDDSRSTAARSAPSRTPSSPTSARSSSSTSSASAATTCHLRLVQAHPRRALHVLVWMGARTIFLNGFDLRRSGPRLCRRRRQAR